MRFFSFLAHRPQLTRLEVERPRWPIALRVLGLCTAAMIAAFPSAAAESQDGRETQLKAAYLFNFVKFVEWPESTPATLTICFRGAADVRELIATGLESKRAGKRQLAVVDLARSADDSGCDVIYLDSAQATAGNRSPRHASHPVLTVSDGKGFAQQDGIIELFTESNRLRFSVNLANADRAGLKISSTLLQLATAITR